MASGRTEAEQMPANTSIDDLLNQTEIGAVIAKNKTVVVGLLVLIIVGVFGYGIYSSKVESKHAVIADRLFDFESNYLQKYKSDNLKAPELVSAFKEVASFAGSFDGLIPAALKVAFELNSKGATAEAAQTLEGVKGLADGHYSTYLVHAPLAAYYEDLGKTDESIAILERLVSKSIKIMEDKTYLDLGRLYLAKGQKEKALANFDYVINSGKQEEFKKVAKLLKGTL